MCQLLCWSDNRDFNAFVILSHLIESIRKKETNCNSANLSETFTNNENHEEKVIYLIALIKIVSLTL